MRSLPEVLREAEAQRAGEIVLASGQRATIQTDGGSSELGDVWTESDLFDALTEVLGPDQQAELAVGQVVEFSLQTAGAGWRLVTEPSSDGVTVRGRANGSAPPPTHAHAGAQEGVSLDLPALEPFRPERETGVPPRRTPRSTRFDIGVDYGPSDEAPPTAASPGAAPLPSAPATVRSQPGVPMEVGPVSSQPLPSPGHANAPGPAAIQSGTLAELLTQLPPGAVCFWRDNSATEDVAVAIAAAVEVVDESTVDAIVALGLSELPECWWMIRLEDPSRCLGFVLRRAEEGGRTLVETRARDGLGAQRILLGPHATAAAGAWLAAQLRFLLWRASDQWSLQAL
jgi:hypothetical protein